MNGTTNSRPFGSISVTHAEYTNNGGPAFSAAYAVTASQSVTGLGYNRQRVDHNTGAAFGGNDFINIQTVSTGGGNNVPASTTLGVAQLVFFADTTSLARVDFSALASARSGASSQTGRIMVQVGASYYLSQSTYALNNTAQSFFYDSTTPGFGSFAAYDPTTAINFDQGTASFNPLSLSSIAGAGLYVENDSFTTPASAQSNYTIATYQLGEFVVTPIPEPASLALLGLGGLMIVGRARRGA